MISLRNVEKFYPLGATKQFVLRQITCDIHQGEFVTIMGQSGAGKSTLLGILGMLDGAWAGEYYFVDSAVHIFADCSHCLDPRLKTLRCPPRQYYL